MSHLHSVAVKLPPTVNIHCIGSCNYDCHFCYARFENSKVLLPLPDCQGILALLPNAGVRKLTFAGGEPTLHPDLRQMLAQARELGLVSALVTNGSKIDEKWCAEFLPEIRWLVLSLDSADPETCQRIGRHPKQGTIDHPAHIAWVAGMVNEWNSANSKSEVLLKINIVVTALNAAEDPSDFLLRLRPRRVKLLQCAVRPGENDDAVSLRCTDEQFAAYSARLDGLRAAGIVVVTEFEEEQRNSYAMIDPRGRFFQSDASGRLTTGRPILTVGVSQAWQDVGGYDARKFVARGGLYDTGLPALGQGKG